MKKSTKFIKKALALFLVVLMSIESFAAIVSDNDGSAFITKAEYDSLKTSFQSQIDRYNSSIDSKIDDAIASYIGGINIATQGKYVSLLHKANDVKDVCFVKSLTTPTSRIGGHHKWGGMIVYQRDSAFPTLKTSKGIDRGGQGLITVNIGSTSYYSVGGYHKFKIGFAKDTYANQFDRLVIEEDNTNDTQKNIVWRIKMDNDGNLYTETEYCKEITPISIVYMACIGGGVATCIFNNSTDTSLNTPTVTISGNFYDFSGVHKGQQMTTLSWTFGNVAYWDPNPGSYEVSNTVDWEESDYSDDSTNMINCLTADKIDDDVTIVGVADAEWDICHSTPYATKTKIVYAWQYEKSQNPGTDTKEGQLSLVDINGYTPVRDTSDIGLPSMKVWMKKYNNYKINNLIHNDWTLATNNIVKYYTGIPLLNSTDNGTVKIVLTLGNSDLSQSADIYIRNESFSNNNTETTNVELFEDRDKTIPITNLTMSSGSASVEKTFYLKAEKDKTYWIKIKPSGTGEVTVDSVSEFEVEYD